MAIFKDTTAGAFADRIRRASEHRAASDDDAPRSQGTRPPRKPVFVNATLILTSGTVPAVVTNVNALGARVEFTGGGTLRGQVVLIAPTIGLKSRVRVAWQHGGSAGLIFMKEEAGTA